MSRSARAGSKPSADERIAVIDLGSNTARIQVFDLTEGGLKPVAGDREALKLMRAVGPDGILAEEAQERVSTTLDRFIEVAKAAGADRIVAVATSALRDSVNGPAFVAALRESKDIEIELIDGDTEARASFWGAVHDVDIDDGVVLDIGGGSLEIARFHDRRLEQHWMVPLGALRLSDRFLKTDPPDEIEVTALVDHVAGVLKKLGVPAMKHGEALVGTGGSIRNIASISRGGGPRPSGNEAGARLSVKDVSRVAALLVASTADERAATPGLSPDRADSIVGGAMTLLTVMAALGAKKLTVSQCGLREGIVLELITRQVVGAALPDAAAPSLG